MKNYSFQELLDFELDLMLLLNDPDLEDVAKKLIRRDLDLVRKELKKREQQ